MCCMIPLDTRHDLYTSRDLCRLGRSLSSVRSSESEIGSMFNNTCSKRYSCNVRNKVT